MALYSKKEFCALCDLKTKHLTTYVERGHIILSNDLIDDTIAENRDFIKKRKDKIKVATESETTFVYPTLEKVKSSNPNRITAKTIHKIISKKHLETPVESDKYTIEKQLKAEKLKETIIGNRIAELKEAKMRGEMMPVELVKSLVITHSESIKIAFSDAAENLIVVFAQKKQMSTAEVADMRTHLTSIINRAIDEAVDASKKNIKHVVEEYSERKGVGEKE